MCPKSLNIICSNKRCCCCCCCCKPCLASFSHPAETLKIPLSNSDAREEIPASPLVSEPFSHSMSRIQSTKTIQAKILPGYFHFDKHQEVSGISWETAFSSGFQTDLQLRVKQAFSSSLAVRTKTHKQLKIPQTSVRKERGAQTCICLLSALHCLVCTITINDLKSEYSLNENISKLTRLCSQQVWSLYNEMHSFWPNAADLAKEMPLV